MNGYLYEALKMLVCIPQETVDDLDDSATHRAMFDPESRPIGSYASEMDLVAVTTRPVEGSYEIGGGVALQHEFDLLLAVQHGDAKKCIELRDAIATELALRLVAVSPSIDALVDPVTGQYGTKVTWLLDYTNPIVNDTSEIARFIITIETQLDS